MKMKIIISIIAAGLGVMMSSCANRDPVHVLAAGNFKDTSGPLKDAASFPIGIGIDYNAFMNDDTYRQTVSTEAKIVTFGYEMKHGAIVQDNGTLNFTNADALFNAATSQGLDVYGHTLAWHQNQNANYLKLYAGIVVPSATELLANPGFELGGAANFTNWSQFNAANGATITVTTTASEIHGGTRAMKVVNPVAHPTQQYQVQMASDLFTTVSGTKYIASYWVKASSAGGSIRLSTQTSGGGSAQYQGDQTIGTTWQLISWTITANSPQTRILLDMGAAANTYFIDDASFKESIPVPSGAQIASKLDLALNTFITQTVTHYKGKVKAWDVVNELFSDNGSIRDNINTPPTTATDMLVWSNYLGKDLGVKAFQYAQAADPDALLFINEYGLESSAAKTDSVIAYVNYLKNKGLRVDGIGTQMHISINTSYGGIDAAFQKLAATGLKIRVSELDVRANPYDKGNFNISTSLGAASNQAVMYKYVVDSYIKNIPADQQYGITIWGVSDKDSWIVLNQKKIDAPLLFDINYEKKPAYAGVLESLKGK